MTDDNDRWIPAAQVLRDVTGRIAAGLGIDKNDAWQEATHAILERLAAGTLLAAPKGFLLQYDGPVRSHRYWFDLRQVEADGRDSPHLPVMEPDWDECCIPSDFWRAFKRADAAARADWASGDFYISAFEDAAGIWSGVARDVQFDRDGLPGAGLPILRASSFPSLIRE